MTRANIKLIGIEELGEGDMEIRFTWHADHRRDWQAALERVKADILPGERSYDPETKEWTCYATAQTQLALSLIFANFWDAVERVRNPEPTLFEARDRRNEMSWWVYAELPAGRRAPRGRLTLPRERGMLTGGRDHRDHHQQLDQREGVGP